MDIVTLMTTAPLGIRLLAWLLMVGFAIVWMIFLREKIGNTFPNPLMKRYARVPRLLMLLWCIRFSLLILIGMLMVTLFFGTTHEKIEQNAAKQASIIVLDISKSMETDDLSPSRIEFAKNTIRGLTPHQRELGIIIFAGKTFVLSPITTDTRGIEYLIETLSTDTINQSESETSGTNIGDALIQASTLFDTKTAEKNVLLITDGRANIGLDPLIAAEALKSKNIRVSILALGSASGRVLTHIVDGKREPLLDGSGNTINGSVDLETLSRLASVTRGTLVHISKDDDVLDLESFYDKNITPVSQYLSPRLDEQTLTLLIALFTFFHLVLSLIVWSRYKTP